MLKIVNCGAIIVVGKTKTLMKIFKQSLLLLLCVLSISFTPKSLSDISKAISKGDTKGISSHFIENIDLKVLEQEDIFSKEQAEMILKSFFEKHPVTSFEIKHTSKPKNNTQYTIGTLNTSNGKFRVYYLTKLSGEVSIIQQFRIEVEDE